MDKLPIPTDNIYKFYAIFGLALFLFGFTASLLTIQQLEARAESLMQEHVKLSIAGADDPKTAKELKLNDALSKWAFDRARWNIRWYFGLQAIGGLLMVYGFRTWHKYVQPLQDQMLRLQLEKLRREVAALPSLTAPGSAVGGSSAENPSSSPAGAGPRDP